MLKVIDRWTTQDGEWYENNKPFGITKLQLEKYDDENIPGRGGSTHIFVSVPWNAYIVEFDTSDGRNKTKIVVATSQWGKWINFPMFHSSAYNPDKGEVGPWHVRIDGELVVEGIGLPHSWHVSTFLVVEDVEPVVIPSPPTSGKDKIQVIVNGVTVYSN